jgi:hypothetical protein
MSHQFRSAVKISVKSLGVGYLSIQILPDEKPLWSFVRGAFIAPRSTNFRDRIAQRFGPRLRRLVAIALSIAVLYTSGCVADDEVDKATTQFVQASTTLTQGYQALLTNANTIEADNYIDNQIFAGAQIDSVGLSGSAVITTNEIQLRTAALKALTDYTTTLATLAANKPDAQIQADAATASSSLKTLTTDATNVFDKPAKGAKTPDFASPVSDAVTAIGDVLKLIEDHRAASAIRASIEQNDTKISPLYSVIEQESSYYFDRETATTNLYGVALFSTYDKIRKTGNPAELMQMGDRFKEYEKDSAALIASDPTGATNAFEKAHIALVKLITAKPGDKKTSLATLIAEVKSFAAEVKAPSKGSNSPSGATSN